MRTSDQQQQPADRDDTNPSLILTGSREYLETCSLVLSSVGIRHSLNLNHASLSVPPAYAEAARFQLAQYFDENRGWPEKPEPARMPASTEKPPTLLTIGGLAVFYMVTGPWQDNSVWFESGAINSNAITEQGEWWRLVTALTLHADQVHLVGNCVIGGFLVHMLCRTIGPGLGWLALIMTGALGNLLNILLRDQVHLSVGFSTSIFAVIGLFSGLQMFAGRTKRLKELLLSIGAGAALLAMLGTEGERTDLGAHFFGFACGLGLGVILSRLPLHTIAANKGLQQKLFILAMVAVLGSWIIALD